MKMQGPTSCRRLAAALAAVAGLVCASWSQALAAEDRVVVLTSYPESFTARYQAAFERRHPGKRVEILWRQSADALAYLRGGGTKEVDVYWTPSPGNFARLRDEGHFAPLALDGDDLPGNVAGFPVSDPGGRFAAFELAGFGIAYNPDAVRRLGVAPPAEWADLADSAYAGKVQLPVPSRSSGFSSALAEAVLQAYGWERGWAVLAGITANAGLAGETVPGSDALAAGRVAARMTIDFIVMIDIAGGAPVDFVYPAKTAYSPAHIAVFAEAPHPETARQFVEFALSAEGQELLLHPDLRRLPVRKSVYDAHPDIAAQPFAAGGLAYDGSLTEARRGLVAELFDVALVAPRAELLPLWRALHDAERAGRGGEPDIRQARALLASPPVDDAAQADAALRTLFARAPEASAEVEAERAAVVARWRAAAAERITAAHALLAPGNP